MKKLYLLVVSLFALLCACASPYDPAPQLLPSYVKNVYVRPIVNNTNQYGLEDKFTKAIIDEFMRDGRLSVVTTEEEADGVVVCEIKRYVYG